LVSHEEVIIKNSIQPSIRVTKYLIYLAAVIWLLLAIILVAGLHPALPEAGIYRWGMAILSSLACVSLGWGYQIMIKRGGPTYYLILGLLAAFSVLTITDQFGLVDLLVLAVHLLAFVLLMKDRSRYLRSA
jgi:hypothetical protein